MAMTIETPVVPESLPVVAVLVKDAVTPALAEISSSDDKVNAYRRYNAINDQLTKDREELKALTSRVQTLEKTRKSEFGDNPDWTEVEALQTKRDAEIGKTLSVLQTVMALTAGVAGAEEINAWAGKVTADLTPTVQSNGHTALSQAKARQNKDIRFWARQRGLTVSDRGAIPQPIENQYFAAHPTETKIES